MRKRRTREHIIADLSVNHVERLVLRCGWTVERTRHDYGIDLNMVTYNSHGEVENDYVSFQLKATEFLKVNADGKLISIRLDWRDLLFWLNERQPVILIVYDAREDKAFWLYIQEYCRRQKWTKRSGATITIHIPVGNILDETAIRQFARFRDESRFE
jgi:hypothetical protein